MASRWDACFDEIIKKMSAPTRITMEVCECEVVFFFFFSSNMIQYKYIAFVTGGQLKTVLLRRVDYDKKC